MRCLILVLAIALGGCAGIEEYQRQQQSDADANAVAPAGYKNEILALMRTYLNDPSNVRGAFVTQPAIRTFDGVSRYAVCLRYNARNTAGQYAGSKDSIVLFRQGKLERIIDNARELCRDAPFQPFPELERISR